MLESTNKIVVKCLSSLLVCLTTLCSMLYAAQGEPLQDTMDVIRDIVELQQLMDQSVRVVQRAERAELERLRPRREQDYDAGGAQRLYEAVRGMEVDHVAQALHAAGYTREQVLRLAGVSSGEDTERFLMSVALFMECTRRPRHELPLSVAAVIQEYRPKVAEKMYVRDDGVTQERVEAHEEGSEDEGEGDVDALLLGAINWRGGKG